MRTLCVIVMKINAFQLFDIIYRDMLHFAVTATSNSTSSIDQQTEGMYHKYLSVPTIYSICTFNQSKTCFIFSYILNGNFSAYKKKRL